ncbi:MAG: hypothetical protein KY468_16035 [Armatimonadetes bacterium]|nr:hypothetical protein [Armatimonadota bacterium]
METFIACTVLLAAPLYVVYHSYRLYLHSIRADAQARQEANARKDLEGEIGELRRELNETKAALAAAQSKD